MSPLSDQLVEFTRGTEGHLIWDFIKQVPNFLLFLPLFVLSLSTVSVLFAAAIVAGDWGHTGSIHFPVCTSAQDESLHYLQVH